MKRIHGILSQGILSPQPKSCHCEERSDEAISRADQEIASQTALAMTPPKILANHANVGG
jgi:hypothetical protein